ncbi:Acg family FMN-binding oxidoreductase [Rhodococcus sp. O3]|uniref:Acg family FMN-binding oxidoreductase n=1 Tax=Rhodococcus sp. O3 TaxID=3404919 RepID=UPI003B67536B
MGTPAESMPDRRTLESAVALACRAPSLHNSQPWRWILGAHALTLYCDNDRILPATDPSGRQMVLSCGTALHHLRTALAAQRWSSEIERMPRSPDRQCLATLRFRRLDESSDTGSSDTEPSDTGVRLAAAIARRRTERLPMAAPPELPSTVTLLQELAEHAGARLDVIGEDERAALDDMSRRISGKRRADSGYLSELNWWTGHAIFPEGVPAETLPAAGSAVAIEREFPPGRATSETAGEVDHAAILLLSTATDLRLDWLRCGEALSVVLLTCTDRGLATCPVTHLTESEDSRAFLRGLTGDGVPQVLIRVGIRTSPASETPTPRRPLSEVLFREHPEADSR